MKTRRTSGQVGQKFDEIRKMKQKRYKNGEGYDYYHTDSDNDGLADVNDADDFNPQIQDIGQLHDSVLNKERLKNLKTENKGNIKDKKSNQFSDKKDLKADNKGQDKKSPKTEKSKKKSQLNFEENKDRGKRSLHTASALMTTAVSSREVLSRGYQVDRLKDSDENAALQATDAGREVSARTIGGTSRKLQHGLKSRNEKVSASRTDARNRPGKQNLNFEKSYKDNKSSQKSGSMSKRYQRQKIKGSYSKKVYGSHTNKAEKTIKGIAKKIKQAIGAVAKKVGIYVAGVAIGMMMLIGTVSAFTGMISNAVSSIVSTSYESDDYEITATENIYNRLEADLKHAIANVESDYSGYDEYRYYIDVVGHDPQVLMAYLTAKYGAFTSSQVSRELSRIFDEHYDYSLTSVTETRHKMVTRIYTDPMTGEIISTTVLVEYDWEVLKVSLNTNDFQSVLIGRLNQEEEELYSILLETKGNFPSLPSPIRGEWKNAVTSMYGYRLDPFDGHVEFHTGIDIGGPVGTELVAVFDGLVTDTGFSSGYGNYIELTSQLGQSVYYAHCNSVDVDIGDEVHIGQKLGEMGSTGNSTGSHLHFEVKVSEGNRLNPYFYLPSD